MYPKWKYHATLPAKIIFNASEENTAGSEWFESPADIGKIEVYEEVKPEPKRKKAEIVSEQIGE